uniref:Uncharacterized protein n=1 Tax=Oryza barthii TaxID=65489 RepID=A0A0D3HV53_9ORYZ
MTPTATAATAATDAAKLFVSGAPHIRGSPSFYDNDDDQARASLGPYLSISVTGHASVAQPSSLADPLGRPMFDY